MDLEKGIFLCYLLISGFALYTEIGGSAVGELIDLLVSVRLEDWLDYTCFLCASHLYVLIFQGSHKSFSPSQLPT